MGLAGVSVYYNACIMWAEVCIICIYGVKSIQVNPSQSKSIQVDSSQSKSIQVNPSQSKSIQVLLVKVVWCQVLLAYVGAAAHRMAVSLCRHALSLVS